MYSHMVKSNIVYNNSEVVSLKVTDAYLFNLTSQKNSTGQSNFQL
jgi:hypothetical protein